MTHLHRHHRGWTTLCTALGFLLAGTLVAAPLFPPPVHPGHPFSWTRFLAPFHMVVLHFPIGILALTSMLEVWKWWRPNEELRRVIQFTLTVAVLASIVTMGLGLLRAVGGDYDPIMLARHRAWGLAAGAVTAIALGLHTLLLRHPGRGGTLAFRLLLLTSFFSLAVAGHQGGSLTHGATYLTENAPDALRNLLGDTSGNPFEQGLAPAEDASSVPVKAVFNHRCITCHGPEKQKNQFRIDRRDILLKGGKSGLPAVVPGDPGKSNLLRLCLLPNDNEDAMPPDGKEPLTPDEIVIVVRWIQAGAPF